MSDNEQIPNCYCEHLGDSSRRREAHRVLGKSIRARDCGRKSSYTYKNVARWTRKVDVFAKELIIVPVHVHGNHWTLAVINFKEKRLEYYD